MLPAARHASDGLRHAAPVSSLGCLRSRAVLWPVWLERAGPPPCAVLGSRQPIVPAVHGSIVLKAVMVFVLVRAVLMVWLSVS
jgi:hypothetical protein